MYNELARDYKKLIYLDIETAPIHKEYHDMPSDLMDIYNSKFRDVKSDDVELHYKNNASFHPEFSRIVCVSMAYRKNGEGILSCKYVTDMDEYKLLYDFGKMMTALVTSGYDKVITHYGRMFDIPFLMKRITINNYHATSQSKSYIPTPHVLVPTTKPWESNLYDTHDIWKFGGNTSSSLNAMCYLLGIESPKNGQVSGETVGPFFHEYGERSLSTIGEYCNADVEALAKVVNRLLISAGHNVSKL